jgi:hypothetical protein
MLAEVELLITCQHLNSFDNVILLFLMLTSKLLKTFLWYCTLTWKLLILMSLPPKLRQP